MSMINPGDVKKLSVASFAKVPAIVGLPVIQRPVHSGGTSSAASLSPSQSARQIMDQSEPCFVTKSILYTNERAHWVNAVRSDKNQDRKEAVEELIICLGIARFDFNLDHRSNISSLDCFIHKSLDAYAFIAVTATLSTLDELISMVRQDNARRQRRLDTLGLATGRSLDVQDCPAFVQPEYELVALHPEHFLPVGSVLTVYDRASGTHKTYVPGSDRVLRESPGALDSPQFPSFSFESHRAIEEQLNPFFVILNAEIKFRRYRRQPLLPYPLLPESVQTLMDRTIELVGLLYWTPTFPMTSQAASSSRPRGVKRSRELPDGSDGELDEVSDGDEAALADRNSGSGRAPIFPEGASQETRMRIGRELMSGHSLPMTLDDVMLLEELGLGDQEPGWDNEGIQRWQNAVEAT